MSVGVGLTLCGEIKGAPARLQFDAINLRGDLDIKAKNVKDIFTSGSSSDRAVHEVSSDIDDDDNDNDNDVGYNDDAVEDEDGEDEGEGEEALEQEGERSAPTARYQKCAQKTEPWQKRFFPLTKERKQIRFYHPMAGLLPNKICCNVFADGTPEGVNPSEGIRSKNIKCNLQFRSNIRRLQHYTPSLR